MFILTDMYSNLILSFIFQQFESIFSTSHHPLFSYCQLLMWLQYDWF